MNKISRRRFLQLGLVTGAALALPWQNVFGQTPPPPVKLPYQLPRRVKVQDRQAAVANAKAAGLKPGAAGLPKVMNPGGDPHYYGPYANYANSPMPMGGIGSIVLDAAGSGYATPIIKVDDVYGTVTTPAVIGYTLGAGGSIASLSITSAGAGYTAPIVTITDTAPGTGSGAAASAAIGGPLTGGIRKFVDPLPGLGVPNVTDPLTKYIPVAVKEIRTYNLVDADYYEIGLVEFEDKFHSDLPTTRLRGYVQLSTAANPGRHIQLFYPGGAPILDIGGQPVYGYDSPRYLGPVIVATKNVPVRVKFSNFLPVGAGGDLFIPCDTTIMGAGESPTDGENFKQNRGTLHNHGALTPWISDGTPFQWTTPWNETTSYPKGVSTAMVPDMPDPGPGSMTFFYTNQQSARLMFYHDHAHGITRLNVYTGEASGYVITDDVEQDLINGTNNSLVNVPDAASPTGFKKVLPDIGIPLIIQDKTFVDAATIAAQDPTWRWGGNQNYATNPAGWLPRTGDLWEPSVYMPAQNPWDVSGASAFGRWQYGPFFWPPTQPSVGPMLPNPYANPANPEYSPLEPPLIPNMPSPSMGMEAFNDTPIVNGVAYPYMEVDPTVVRFRILSVANDRFFNLHFYVADPSVVTADGRTNTEVKMVPALANPAYPPTWSADGRAGGVPDPFMAGPSWIQIGTEGGFLPEPVVISPQPLNWNMNATAFNVGNVTDHSLLLGPAERADVLVDFSQFAGQTLIMYNDAPAAFPALDPRYDYYTGNPDQTSSGSTPTTQPGYGPNTRAIMQLRVLPGGAATGQPLTGVTVTSGGQDYDVAPTVVFTGGGVGATQASATASCAVAQIDVINPGAGTYVTPPLVEISGGGGTGAQATATIAGGYLTGIVVTNPGAGYTTAPSVTVGGPTGTGIALASLSVTAVTLTSGSVGLYTSLPQVLLLGGGGNGATAVAALTAAAAYDMTTLKAVWAKGPGTKRGVFERGSEPIIVPQAIYNSAYNTTFPSDVPSQYVQLHDFTKSFTSHTLSGLALVSGGAGYPASTIVQGVFSGGGGGSGAAATADVNASGVITAVTLTDQGNGYTAAPTVDFSGGTTAAVVNVNLATVTNMTLEPKAIHDEMNAAYDPVYGRMSGLLGLELPVTNALNQNMTLLGYESPPVDVVQNSFTPLGTTGDGTQIWKITHNGVDTHPIHFHLVNVQIVNRVAWDLAMLPPEPNEVGWKETVRVNPLEHCIVAMRPVAPTLPFDLPNSIRVIDPTKPVDVPLMGGPIGFIDPAGEQVAVTNHLVNFGWEYVWHCHILSHEEMDMMHSLNMAMAPAATGLLTGTLLTGGPLGRRIQLNWASNAPIATRISIERAGNQNFTGTVTVFTVDRNLTTGIMPTTYLDRPVAANTPYFYRVRAGNVVGDTTVYAAPAVGWPTVTAWSAYSNVVALAPPAAPTLLVATRNGSSINFTWQDNATNETGFWLQRANSVNGPWNTTVNPNIPAFPGTGQTGVSYSPPGGTRYYRVLAVNSFGQSSASNVVSFTR